MTSLTVASTGPSGPATRTARGGATVTCGGAPPAVAYDVAANQRASALGAVGRPGTGGRVGGQERRGGVPADVGLPAAVVAGAADGAGERGRVRAGRSCAAGSAVQPAGAV